MAPPKITATALWILTLLLSGCRFYPEAQIPMPSQWLSATEGQTASRLVIFLPGRGDSIEAYPKNGFIRAMQAAGWDADALVLDAHLGYYATRTLPDRFATEVFPIIREREYEEVWIAGISLGGLGAILVDREFPGTIDGIILLAPYLGDDRELLRDLTRSGIEDWSAPTSVAPDDIASILWIHLQSALREAGFREKIWLGYGTNDRFAPWNALLGGQLPTRHVITVEGGRHDWKTWQVLWAQLLETVPAPPTKPGVVHGRRTTP